MLLHGLVADDLVGVVMLEFERVARLGAAELDLGNALEKVGHRTATPLLKIAPTVRKVGNSV